MDSLDGLLLLIQPGLEILVEAFEVVYSWIGIYFIGVGRDEGRPYLFPSSHFEVVVFDQGGLEFGHLNIIQLTMTTFIRCTLSNKASHARTNEGNYRTQYPHSS